MTSSSEVPGSCLCGAVRFSVRLPTLWCGHCHCTMCQRNHGAGYVTWFAVERSALTFQAGESELSHYESSEHGTRSFCPKCGSSLFCESTRHPDQIDVVLANVQGELDRPPQFHVFFDDRADWIDVRDDLPRLAGGGDDSQA